MVGDHRTRPPPGGDVDRGEGDRAGNPSSAPRTLIVCLHPVLQPEQPSRQPSEMPALITQLILTHWGVVQLTKHFLKELCHPLVELGRL